MSGHERAENATQRIEAFSDGVFAIAITLLIIEIKVPHLPAGEPLGAALIRLWPSYFAYFLSFLMIGIYWANHHSFFKLFRRTDHVFNLLNVFFLMCIAFMPFPTAVLGDYVMDAARREAAVVFYCLGLLLPAFSWLTLWLYARAGYRMLDERLDPGFVRFLTIQYLVSNALYVTAFLLAFVNPTLGLGICVAMTLVYLLPPKPPVYRG